MATLRYIFVALMIIAPFGAYAEIASSTYVDEKVQTAVQTTGDQTVAGEKTYTESPIVPTPPLP